MDRRPPYANARPVDPTPEGVLPQISNGISYQPPHVLDPDYGPQTIHRSDLFFINSTPHMNTRKKAEFSVPNSASPSSISTQLYPYHQQAFHHHFNSTAPPPPSNRPTYAHNPPYYDHRQRSSTLPARPPPSIPPPPLPPKPIVYPSIGTTAIHDNFPIYTAPHLPPPPPIPPPPDEQPAESPVEDPNELAMVLALSQSESVQRQILEEQLQQKEDEDLAKALAESILPTGSNLQPSSNPFFAPSNDLAPISETKFDDSTIRSRPVPVDLAPTDKSSPPTFGVPKEVAHTKETHFTDSGYSEFGRHEKWRIPGFSQTPRTEDNSSEIMREDSAPESSSFSSSGHHDPPSEATESSQTRPLSISSASSLPYTQPSPISNTFGTIESLPGYAKDGRESSPRPPSPPAAQESFSLQPTSDTVLVFDDEAYARQLAAEEEELARQEQYPSDEKRRFEEIPDEPQEGLGLPVYSVHNKPQWQPANKPTSNLYSVQESTTPYQNLAGPSTSSHPLSYNATGQAKEQDLQFRPGTSFSEPSSSVSFSPVVYPSLGHHRESESDTHSEASHHSSVRSTASAPVGHSDRPFPHLETPPHPSRAEVHRPSFSGPSSLPVPPPENRISGHAPHAPSPGVLNANHFLDRELLLGVSIAFKPPAISTRIVPMQDAVPNIISMPHARCPPLHVQAPDWRHLLRLMARLSGTRIEPTVEAMAISKTDLKLRTVVQFVKPHPSLSEWRTVIWFTIDHPVPPNTPGSSRYLSGNVNLLPWSYTLNPIPILLRDAHDTPLSKTYTIPASEAVPLPTLPITFPNLALYLQAALDYSRRHSSDGSSGLGKLGKVVQMCYPNVEQTSEFDIPERNTVSHLFKRVIGRSNKAKKNGKGMNNEDTYQLVTPFVPDEWG